MDPPHFALPPSTLVLFTEEVGGYGSSVTIFRGHVGEMGSLAPELEQVSPTWVFECVLKVRTLQRHIT